MATTTSSLPNVSSEHIRQLADIDRDVAKLVRSAGLAVKALTQLQSDGGDAVDSQGGFPERKKSFTNAASQYFNTLSSIDVRLRRQINALEEADIIPAESVTRDPQSKSNVPAAMPGMGSAPNAAATNQGGPKNRAITGGGLGSLDVGWLNSRNDNVGKEMEAELWEQAQQLLQKLEGENAAGLDRKATDSDENMSDQIKPQPSVEEMNQT